jgi:hypothetical protein
LRHFRHVYSMKINVFYVVASSSFVPALKKAIISYSRPIVIVVVRTASRQICLRSFPVTVLKPSLKVSCLQAAPVTCDLQVLYYQIHWPPSSCAACRESCLLKRMEIIETLPQTWSNLLLWYLVWFSKLIPKIFQQVYQGRTLFSETFESRGEKTNIYLRVDYNSWARNLL